MVLATVTIFFWLKLVDAGLSPARGTHAARSEMPVKRVVRAAATEPALTSRASQGITSDSNGGLTNFAGRQPSRPVGPGTPEASGCGPRAQPLHTEPPKNSPRRCAPEAAPSQIRIARRHSTLSTPGLCKHPPARKLAPRASS